MKITPEILSAIRQAVDFYGNTSQFAKKIGVAHSTVLFWISGKTNNISGTIWDNRVRRELNKFLPKNDRQQLPRLCESRSEFPLFKKNAEKIPAAVRQTVPAVNFSLMAELDITMQSPVSFVKKRCSAEVSFASDWTEFSFALLLDKPEYCPRLPLGSRLLIAGGEYAEDDDIVVGKMRSPAAELFICRYHRLEDKIRLQPLNPEQKDLEWDSADNAEKIFWMFPVREISVNLDSSSWV